MQISELKAIIYQSSSLNDYVFIAHQEHRALAAAVPATMANSKIQMYPATLRAHSCCPFFYLFSDLAACLLESMTWRRRKQGSYPRKPGTRREKRGIHSHSIGPTSIMKPSFCLTQITSSLVRTANTNHCVRTVMRCHRTALTLVQVGANDWDMCGPPDKVGQVKA